MISLRPKNKVSSTFNDTRIFLMGIMSAFLSGCASKFRSYGGPEVTRVRLYKGQRLLVLDGVDRVLQTYPVRLGFAPEGHK